MQIRLLPRFRNIGFAFAQLPIQQKLILSYVIVILFPSFFISNYLFKQSNENNIRLMMRQNEYSLEVEKINIANNMETMVRTAELAASKEVASYLSMDREPDALELIGVRENQVADLLRLQYNNPNIEHIRIYFDNPNINEIWPVFFRASRLRDQAWPKEGEGLGTSEQWRFERTDEDPIPVLSPKEGIVSPDKPKISLFREIDSYKGERIGLLQVDMLLTSFLPKTFSSIDNGSSQAFLADGEGRLFTNPDNSFLADRGMKDTDVLNLFRSKARDGQTSFEFRQGGEPFLCTYAYIDGIDATMMNVASLETVYRENRTNRNQLLLATVVLIGILSLITYSMNFLILRNLKVLVESMKKAYRGNFTFDIPLRASGEIGELVFYFRKMLRSINEFVVDAVNRSAVTKEAELRSLRSQIDSHFLYNTLESIKMMAEIEEQYPISDALTSLGGMMRYNMNWSSEYSKLKEEIQHIQNYVALMNIRFDDEIELTLDVPSALFEHEVLKMSLQPIVENAVKHGAEQNLLSRRKIRIAIRAFARGGCLMIEIADNGTGMPADRLAELQRKIDKPFAEPASRFGAMERNGEGRGIGLRNVNQRIRLYYGQEYGIAIASEEGKHTTVAMKLPYLLLSGG